MIWFKAKRVSALCVKSEDTTVGTWLELFSQILTSHCGFLHARRSSYHWRHMSCDFQGLIVIAENHAHIFQLFWFTVDILYVFGHYSYQGPILFNFPVQKQQQCSPKEVSMTAPSPHSRMPQWHGCISAGKSDSIRPQIIVPMLLFGVLLWVHIFFKKIVAECVWVTVIL